MSITVIKLGGSLMRSAELTLWLNCIVNAAKKTNIVIVPGGGEFAELVRNIQKEREFDDVTAHHMALFAMCQFGYLLNGLNKHLSIIEEITAFSSHFGKNLPLLWLPTSLIHDDSEIPASWEYTSDSISLWLANKLSANRLVLVKSKKIVKQSLRNSINNDDLDQGFQELSCSYSGEILFFEKSESEQFMHLMT